MKEKDVELTELLEKADEYATFAVEHFSLDALPEPANPSELMNIIYKLEAQDLYAASEHDKFILHFLFPNLSDADRLLVGCIHAMCWAIKLSRLNGYSEDEERARLAKYMEEAAQSDLESKLTAIQLRLLESDWGDPDSEVSIEY